MTCFVSIMQYLPYTFIIVSRIISNKQLAVAVLITRLFRSRLTKFHNDSLGRLYSQTDKLQTPRPKHIHTSSFVGRFCRFLTSYAGKRKQRTGNLTLQSIRCQETAESSRKARSMNMPRAWSLKFIRLRIQPTQTIIVKIC